MTSVMQMIDKLLQTKKVVVISKTYCPFCITAKDVLDKYDIPPDDMEVMEIENLPACQEIQDYMLQLTGARTVPRVFIGGKCVGGGNDVARLHQQGQLRSLLKEAKAIL